MDEHARMAKNSNIRKPVKITNLQNLEQRSQDELESPIHERLLHSQEIRMKKSIDQYDSFGSCMLSN